MKIQSPRLLNGKLPPRCRSNSSRQFASRSLDPQRLYGPTACAQRVAGRMNSEALRTMGPRPCTALPTSPRRSRGRCRAGAGSEKVDPPVYNFILLRTASTPFPLRLTFGRSSPICPITSPTLPTSGSGLIVLII